MVSTAASTMATTGPTPPDRYLAKGEPLKTVRSAGAVTSGWRSRA